MHWPALIAYFFAGAFGTNAIPHLVSGLTGRSFPSVFSKPPGIGPSSATVNFLWGWANLVAAYLLVFRVGVFDGHSMEDPLALGLGSLLIGTLMSRHFGNLHGQK